MNKLLSMELKRAIMSPILWIGILAIIAVNAYGITLNTYGFEIYTTSFLFTNSALICIILAIFIALHISRDFESRTINNKITAGYTRKQIYLTEIIVGAIYGTVLFAVDLISVFVCSTVMNLKLGNEISYTALVCNVVINLICIITISVLFTMLATVTRKQLISLGFTVLLTLFLLNLGNNTVSKLRQSEYNFDNQSDTTVKNTLYVDGAKRTVANIHLLISPFAQVKYQSSMLLEPEFKETNSVVLKSFPYHIEFCAFNILEILLFYKAGLLLFKKHDLK